MKLSRSLLSPGRDPGPASLPSSLSRRLRSNGSLKGGASPFLTTPGKRRGAGFENPEPSSPKVTCIGQVRVKTKKKVKQSRSLSKRRSADISFRKIEHPHHQHLQSTTDNNNGHDDNNNKIRFSNASSSAHYQGQQQGQECNLTHRNQRWVHLPVSICEALRDYSCLFPCKTSCFSREKADDNNEAKDKRDEKGCGAVFARWLNDGEGGNRREIELVVGDGDEERVSMRSSRRHVFDDIEVKDDNTIEVKGRSLSMEGGEEEEEKGRVSICIPPKNALLLMRCRSDPMKMASLAHRFSWDPVGVCENVDEEIEEETSEVVVEEKEDVVVRGCEGGSSEVVEQDVAVLVEKHDEVSDEVERENSEINQEEEMLVISEEAMVEEKEEEVLKEEILMGINEEELDEEIQEELRKQILEIIEQGLLLLVGEEEKQEVESNMDSFEALLDQENQNTEHYYEDNNNNSPPIDQQEEEVRDNISHSIVSNSSPSTSTESDAANNEITPPPPPPPPLLEESNTSAEKDSIFVNDEEKIVISEIGNPKNHKDEILPDCLLLMMCEPKLSMEVSKETWVCSTDFIRWLPERPRRAAPAARGRLSVDSRAARMGAGPRSFPAMAAVLEQKVAEAVGYEPFVLKRCKSEPMRTAAAKLMPAETCFWKNAVRKMEPAMGLGAAGVGF